MNRRLILDTDGGVDDAQALLMLIAADKIPDAITTVFGNVGLDAATRNILSVLAVAGKENLPVHKGADRPLTQPVIDAIGIHGDDGLGGAPRPESVPAAAGSDGVGFLIASLKEAARSGAKIDLLMIGPLTNLALALRVAPDCIEGIGQLTIMGGSVYGRGNVTPAAEFNIFADPEAAGIVFGAEIDTVVLPWETCAGHTMTGAAVDALFAQLPDGREKEFSLQLARHARQVIAAFGGGDHFRFVDPLAAAVVIEPAIVKKSLRASVDVALAPGLTRGMTVVDPTGRLATPMVTLVEEVEMEPLIAFYQASIAYRSQGD
ncbi:nucleoside hydrolase [Pelagibacterium luteolum]|uniref:Non-specific riboncleoside hydrolase n=1 Tax=Pelagibacterium luteolum TaxID=440168 RepID=A0A1G7XF23_9HYPH|nr:nucleoside hydrolase [Pelagibacterium luteolum]SDG82812.1 non-specific riboncleoside hydrolase [Pelagibacterium luteolum]